MKKDHQTLFDVKVARVNSTGTFTEIYIKMSRFNSKIDMYEPFEEKILWPKVQDPNGDWIKAWKECFAKSAESLITGKNGVPLKVGVNVLKLAELGRESYLKGGILVKNKTID